MSKHTLGPWTLSAGRNISTKSGDFYLTYGNDKYGNPYFRDFCELDANARLIAAAPDLLAALESILVYAENEALSLDSLKDSEFSAYEAFAALEAVDSARAAIAKAKGE